MALGLLVLIAGVVVLKDRCGPGAKHLGPDRECIGVTDGSFDFPGLQTVSERIATENRRVEEERQPVVTLAYVLSLDPTDPDWNEEMRHELEGAHLAQLRANQSSTMEATNKPQIRLLVANAGKENGQWEAVVERLLKETDAHAPLVAVLGFGQSRTTTLLAIQRLTDREVPVIAVRLTADSLSPKGHNRVKGLVRVSPINRDEARAAVAYLRDKRYTALLVQDDNDKDLYSKTLGQQFTNTFPLGPYKLVGTRMYNSELGRVPFSQMTADICLQNVDVIYFAGRAAALQDLLQALPDRPCADRDLMVVTGDDASQMSAALQKERAKNHQALEAGLANVTLLFTGLAHPQAWTAQPGFFKAAATHPFESDCDICFKTVFPGESLFDGAAIMAYDGVQTAVKAIRRDRALNGSVTRAGIIQQWYFINSCQSVSGASGSISLDEDGNPRNKAMPILRLRSDGLVEFKELTSSEGTPAPPPSCGALPSP